MKPVDRIPAKYRPRKKQIKPEIKPIPTKSYAWDLVFGYIDGESFEHGVYDAVIYEEDIAFASWYAERRNYE